MALEYYLFPGHYEPLYEMVVLVPADRLEEARTNLESVEILVA